VLIVYLVIITLPLTFMEKVSLNSEAIKFDLLSTVFWFVFFLYCCLLDGLTLMAFLLP
jgi:hypothetical protein